MQNLQLQFTERKAKTWRDTHNLRVPTELNIRVLDFGINRFANTRNGGKLIIVPVTLPSQRILILGKKICSQGMS
eukprot:583861-Amphidinium_carterae.1